VIHWEIPESLEAYYQEAGRAGRDEQKAYAILLYNENDIINSKEKLKESYPSIDFIKKVYQSLANYYKIAVGSANFASFDFDRNDFERVYKLPRLETFYALKRLESEGYIQLNEVFNSSSKIVFTIDNKKLYEFQIANEKFDGFIKTLLRMYGGEMFSNFISISEKEISKSLQVSSAEVSASLQYLEKLNILEYDMQKNKPQLIFTTPRLDASKLPLDIKKIEERKENDTRKLEAVIDYAKQNERCRTIVLLDYFGEVTDDECGVCDVCLRKKKELGKADKYSLYKNKILTELKECSQSIELLINKIDKSNKEQVIEVIRLMLDSGELMYDKDQNIKINK
jgi:ATP-dependent DNA helicase RecQ